MKNLVHIKDFQKTVFTYKDFTVKVTSIKDPWKYSIDSVNVRYRITDNLRPEETILTSDWVSGCYYFNAVDLNNFKDIVTGGIDKVLKGGYREQPNYYKK